MNRFVSGNTFLAEMGNKANLGTSNKMKGIVK